MPATKRPHVKGENRRAQARVEMGAVPSDALDTRFPPIDLPVTPPVEPLDAVSVDHLPDGNGWQYEPKWDGFRCVAFRHQDEVLLQSKSGQRLDRYFPELVDGLRALRPSSFVLDGEIVIEVGGELSFDHLLQRIHPAESRVRKLAAEAPATLLAFDLLVDARAANLMPQALGERRRHLEKFFARLNATSRLHLSPATIDHTVATKWMRTLVGHGLDGVVAKRIDAAYVPGDRRSMVKVKPARTADCVVGGFRYDATRTRVASLLLGLYDDAGLLDHVGFAASFTDADRRALKAIVEPLRGGTGFTGRAPGGPSRWSRGASTAWEPLRPSLVCEVAFDHFSGHRFRHGTTLLRWRPDKRPDACTFTQVAPPHWSGGLERLLAATR
jgi:ATP-dependent DNA ligase